MSPLQTLMRLRTLHPGKHKPLAGDVFCLSFLERQYYFGRVMMTDLMYYGMATNLLYFYEAISDSPDRIPVLDCTSLLIPPVITFDSGWRSGLIQHVQNIPLNQSDLLSKHCFYWKDRNLFVNERGITLSHRCEPCGAWEITTNMGIDLALQGALNMPQIVTEDTSEFYGDLVPLVGNYNNEDSIVLYAIVVEKEVNDEFGMHDLHELLEVELTKHDLGRALDYDSNSEFLVFMFEVDANKIQHAASVIRDKFSILNICDYSLLVE